MRIFIFIASLLLLYGCKNKAVVEPDPAACPILLTTAFDIIDLLHK